jgi:structural maintenance of chromosome 1
MDAIVVDTKQVASECIRYLKEHRIGTCSFLPLDNISPKEIPEWLRSLSSSERFRICIDLIDMDSDMFRPAVLYAVGSAVVCDSLDEAREICFTRESTRGMKLKAVTLGGHVISKNGTMTGGAVAREGSNRWEEKELEKLRKEKIELEEFLNENKRNTPSRQQLIDIETKIKTIQIRLNLCSADSQVCEEKRDQFEHQQRLRDVTLSELQIEKDSINKVIGEKRSHLEELENVIRDIESQVFGQFSNRIGVDNIREYEETRIKKHKEFIKQKNNFAEQRSTLEAQLEYELKKDFESALQNCEKQLTGTKSEIETLKKSISELTKETDKITKECDALNVIRDDLKKQKKSQDAHLRGLQMKRNDLTSKKETVMKKASAQDILLERLRLQLHETLKKAQVDEISLPAIVHLTQETDEMDTHDLSWKGSITSLRSDDATSRTRHGDVESMDLSLRSDEMLKTVDLSSIIAVHGSGRKEFQIEKEATLSNDIRVLTEELEAMQPNMHAVERYDGVVEKLKECSTDLDSVRDVAKDITTRFVSFRTKSSESIYRFEHIREERKTLFENCFNHVSESLAIIYRDLTKSSKHPLGNHGFRPVLFDFLSGGNAYLTLDNTEEPFAGGIRYTAMPPSKRFRS